MTSIEPTLPFFVSIPHSGEKVPDETPWLKNLPEPLLFQDVDRYVDVLYGPGLQSLKIPFVKTEWHRYAADLNRIPEDVDQDSVIGSKVAGGTHPRGFHWVMTTHRERLMPHAMPHATHEKLIKLIYEPFHQQVASNYRQLKALGYRRVFHLDAHSMPSLGTSEHRDPGEYRADIVVSDCKGKSCDADYKDLVIQAYAQQGFKVAYNWPYFGGRVTEQYGKPVEGFHAIQVELNRALYMNETTKKLKSENLPQIQQKLSAALQIIKEKIQDELAEMAR